MSIINMTEKENIISVTGYGRLFVNPNYLKVYASIGCRSNSLKTSLEGVNDDMKKLFDILDKIGIDKKLINIVDLKFGPKYEYKNHVNQFLGYDVDQRIDIEFDVNKENEDKASKIISEITSLKYISTCNIEYGLRDKKIYLEKVRELSYNNALEKAEQYATLAGVRIVKANVISDRDAVTEYSRSNSNFVADDIDYDPDSYLPKGKKIVMENKVFVTFDIEK